MTKCDFYLREQILKLKRLFHCEHVASFDPSRYKNFHYDYAEATDNSTEDTVGNSLFKLEPGAVLDKKYRIDAIIGSGGMGYVYKATNIILKREVAVKTLQKQKGADDSALKRFHQEAQIAASVGHDNICEVIDFGTHSFSDSNCDVFYLVMPLLIGKSLGQWFDSWVRPSPAVFIDVMAQTLLGLHAAHKKKIVHRDLKPDNIYITNIGDRDNFVKILDFGISKYLESDAALSLTKTGIAMGTPLYMAPEQAKGSKNIDHTVDIYSMGVVLYEGFVGQLPYKGDNFNDVLLKIATKPFPAPRAVNAAVPAEIEKVILKAMSRTSVDRYHSAFEMRKALLKAAASSNIDERKSFVYPSSVNSSNSEKQTIDLHPEMPAEKNTRVAEKLKAMTPHPKEDPKPEKNSDSSSKVLKILIGVIVVSLIAAILGVAYIVIQRRESSSSDTNVIPAITTPTSDADNNSVDQITDDSVPKDAASTADTDDVVKMPSVPSEDIVAPEVNDEENKTSARRKKSRRKSSSRTVDTSEKEAMSAAPIGNGKNRDIERDADSIFDWSKLILLIPFGYKK